jgi:hypothetical protein
MSDQSNNFSFRANLQQFGSIAIITLLHDAKMFIMRTALWKESSLLCATDRELRKPWLNFKVCCEFSNLSGLKSPMHRITSRSASIEAMQCIFAVNRMQQGFTADRPPCFEVL